MSNVYGAKDEASKVNFSSAKLRFDYEENPQPPSDPAKLASPSFHSTDSLTYSKRTFNESQTPADIDKWSEFTGPNLWAEALKQNQEQQQTKQDNSNILQSSLLRESFDTENNTSSLKENLLDSFGSLFNTVEQFF